MRHTEPTLAVEAAEALAVGGVPVVEVTWNSAGVLPMIRAITETLGNRVLVGVGTVLDLEAAEAAVDAGAEFVVSPHTDPTLVAAMVARGVPAIPGALSPTEVVAAWKAGASLVKVFPAASVGPGHLKDLRGPLPEVPYLPTGGVNLDNAPAFMAAGAWGLGLGSALVDATVVRERRWDDLSKTAAAFAAIAGRAVGAPA